MIGSQEQFSELRLETQDVDIILGDDNVVSIAGIGTVSFQRESLPPLKLQQLFLVTSLRKNLFYVSCIEDVGFTVNFTYRQVLVYPRGRSISEGKVIGVR